jgi:hypothetical protein
MDILWDKYTSLRPGAERNAFRLQNHVELERISRHFDPQGANTLASALVTDYLADGLIVIAANKLAPLALFSRKFNTAPLSPRDTVQVPKATAGATSQTNASNWETGDSTLTNVAVTVNQISQSFHLTNDQLNKGFELAQLAAINADVFANAISDIWTALDIVGNFGTAQIIGLSSAFDPADLPAIFTTAKNFRVRNLLLDGAYIGQLFPGVVANFQAGIGLAQQQSRTVFPGLFGFDNIAMQNRWTGATANSVGFVASPDAIAVAAGLPIAQPPGEFISLTSVNVDGAGSNSVSLGLVVQLAVWYARASRTVWASYDVMFGAAPGDTTQGKGLVSA